VVLYDGGARDTKGVFIKQLKKEAGKKQKNGAALRWAIAATKDRRLELQLHALPAPAATVNSKLLLQADDAPVIIAASWGLSSSFFDGQNGLTGPVPVLFTPQPEELRSKIKAEQDDFFSELNAFMGR
jgi:hypothetical protein